jgi:hypothetical protein
MSNKSPCGEPRHKSPPARANEEALPPLADKGLIAAPPDVSEKAEEMRTHPESLLETFISPATDE